MPNKGPVALGAREELTKDHSFSAVLWLIPHLTVQDSTTELISVEASAQHDYDRRAWHCRVTPWIHM